MAVAAVAQPVLGSGPGDYPAAAAVQVMAGYARCAARSAPTEARALVRADADDPDHAGRVRAFALSQRSCVPRGGRLTFGPLAFVGGMAEALLDARRRDPATLAAAAVASRRTGLGPCLLRNAPAKTTALLATMPATANERSAIDQLREFLPGCIPAGRQLVLNPIAIRAIVAIALYRAVTD